MSEWIRSRWKLWLPDYLSPAQESAFRDIPGVQVRRKKVYKDAFGEWLDEPMVLYWLESGPSARFDLVEQLGRLYSDMSAIRAEPPEAFRRGLPEWSPRADEALTRVLFESRLKSWLSDGIGGPWSLLPYQRQAVFHLWVRGGGILKASPGAGKTVQAIAWAMARDAWPVLFVTPSAVLKQYARSVRAFTDTTVIELPAPSKLPVRNKVRLTPLEFLAEQLADPTHKCVVVGADSLRGYAEALTSRAWGSTVFDESQLFKSYNRRKYTKHEDGEWTFRWVNNRSALAEQIAAESAAVLCTTATPIFDRRKDLWGQVSLVEPDGWGVTAKRFLKRYAGAYEGRYGLVINERTHNEELEARLQEIMHVVPKSVSHAELPPTVITVRYLESGQLTKADKSFARETQQLGRLAKSGSREAAGQLTELMLQMAASMKRDVVVDECIEFVEGDDNGKGKVLVFSGRHRDAWELADAIQARLPDVEVLRGIESVGDDEFALPSDARRDEIAQSYMAHPGPCVFVATGQAWGTGLDLQDTDLLQVVMLPPNPGPFVQWLGRIQRLGQQRSASIYVYIGEGTADERYAAFFGDKSTDFVELLGDEELREMPQALRGLGDLDTVIDGVIAKMEKALTTTEDWSDWDE